MLLSDTIGGKLFIRLMPHRRKNSGDTYHLWLNSSEVVMPPTPASRAGLWRCRRAAAGPSSGRPLSPARSAALVLATAFQLAEDAHDLEHGLAHRAGGVELLLVQEQIDVVGVDFIEEADEVEQRAPRRSTDQTMITSKRRRVASRSMASNCER